MDKWPEVFSISIHSAARAETQLDDANGTGDGGISIHSAARAETEALAKQLREMRFQSTPPRGRRHGRYFQMVESDKFQSTPPRGRRRMREEVRPVKQTISIHSAARAETDKLRYNKSVLKFQSTPPRGRRQSSQSKESCMPVFQSTPPRGRRRVVCD